MKELERLAAEIPNFPEAREIESHRVAKTDSANLSKAFVSKASYDEIKRFYFAELTRRGWKFEGERSLSTWGVDYGTKQIKFDKGEYEIAIQYEGRRNTGKDFGIDYSWISEEARE